MLEVLRYFKFHTIFWKFAYELGNDIANIMSGDVMNIVYNVDLSHPKYMIIIYM